MYYEIKETQLMISLQLMIILILILILIIIIIKVNPQITSPSHHNPLDTKQNTY